MSIGFLFLLVSHFVFPGHGELCGLCLATCQISSAASWDATLQGWDIPQQDLSLVEQSVLNEGGLTKLTECPKVPLSCLPTGLCCCLRPRRSWAQSFSLVLQSLS